MAYGRWGGRLWPVNWLVTNALFACTAGYCRFRRLINSSRSAVPTMANLKAEDARSRLEQFFGKGLRKVNLGGGAKNLAGFINIDFVKHCGVGNEIVANILDLSFIPDTSVIQVHSNHVLEHLSESQIRDQFPQWHRILKRDGVATIRVPSAIGAAYAFWFNPIIESNREHFGQLGFPCDESFGDPADAWLHRDVFALMHWFYGDVGNVANQHLTQITPTKLRMWLEEAAFDILAITEPEALNIAVVARARSGK